MMYIYPHSAFIIMLVTACVS